MPEFSNTLYMCFRISLESTSAGRFIRSQISGKGIGCDFFNDCFMVSLFRSKLNAMVCLILKILVSYACFFKVKLDVNSVSRPAHCCKACSFLPVKSVFMYRDVIALLADNPL